MPFFFKSMVTLICSLSRRINFYSRSCGGVFINIAYGVVGVFINMSCGVVGVFINIPCGVVRVFKKHILLDIFYPCVL